MQTGALRRRAAELPQVAGPAQSQVQDEEEAGTEAPQRGASAASSTSRAEHCAAATCSQHSGSHSAAAAGTGFHGPANRWRTSDGCRHVTWNDGNAATFLTGNGLQGLTTIA